LVVLKDAIARRVPLASQTSSQPISLRRNNLWEAVRRPSLRLPRRGKKLSPARNRGARSTANT
jgi:hypothetical protein